MGAGEHSMQIVSVDKIPSNVVDCPEGDLVEVYKICKQMHSLCKSSSGVGLSAVQVGVPWRLFVIDFEDSYRNFLNCLYKQEGDEKFESIEGCLSIKKDDGSMRYFKLSRFQEITLIGKELVEIRTQNEGKIALIPFKAKLKGNNLANVVFQHEIDHQNQVLISDIGKEVDINDTQ